MALTQIDFDEDEEKIIERYSKKWELNKPKTVRKVIVKFKDGEEKQNESKM